MKPILVLTIAVLLAIPGCRGTFFLSTFSGTGTISIGDAECRSWFVHDDSGRLYELAGLPAEMQAHGLRVRFTLKLRDDLATVCMRGKIAEVVSISRI